MKDSYEITKSIKKLKELLTNSNKELHVSF